MKSLCLLGIAVKLSAKLMLYRIIFLVFLSCIPAVSLTQSRLVAKEIRFHFEDKDVAGTIADFRSDSEVNLENLSNSFFKGSVGVSSLKTGNFLRDWAIKGRKYFNEDEYPRIFFDSTEVTETEEGIRVKGVLTLKGKTKPFVIRFRETERGLSGQAELYTSDFGISIKKKREENKVVVIMDFELE